jgi:hypothetical protein
MGSPSQGGGAPKTESPCSPCSPCSPDSPAYPVEPAAPARMAVCDWPARTRRSASAASNSISMGCLVLLMGASVQGRQYPAPRRGCGEKINSAPPARISGRLGNEGESELGEAENGLLILQSWKTLTAVILGQGAQRRVPGISVGASAGKTTYSLWREPRSPGCGLRPYPRMTVERSISLPSSGSIAARTASRCRRVSARHRSGGRGCTGRNGAWLPSGGGARSSHRR